MQQTKKEALSALTWYGICDEYLNLNEKNVNLK